MSDDIRFLKNMSMFDETCCCGDLEKCGFCYHGHIFAEVAREMLERGETEDVIAVWVEETTRRWQNSKFFLLWQEATKQGLDPHKVFKEKGWSP
jgi:hypothetical protein